MNETDLLALCRAGNHDAFATLHSMHKRRVSGAVRKILRTWPDHDIEDVAQEVFLKAWLHIDRFTGEATFATWIYRIATNTALMKLRRRKSGKECDWFPLEMSSDEGATWTAEPGGRCGSLAGATAHIDVAVALGTLQKRQRQTLQLRYLVGMNFDQIAEAMGTTSGCAKSQAHRALRNARARIEVRR